MKIKLANPIAARRGAAPKPGNVYAHRRGYYFKVCLAVVQREGSRPWNNVVLLHVDAKGEIVGSSNAPELYVQDHHDLIGSVEHMPELKIRFNEPKETKQEG